MANFITRSFLSTTARVASICGGLLLIECTHSAPPIFRLVPPGESGLDFQNTITEDDSVNILAIQYIYHGGAVAIGDFNNDGRYDLFLTGNMVSNRLYLNRGNLQFEDVSEHAGIAAPGRWCAGAALADVNGDGLLDIYVCATIRKNAADRTNLLFINQGLDENGIPSFRDQAPAYGVADTSYSQNAAFLDYDKDGDLDLYVLNNLESDKIPSVYRPKITDGSALNNDHLYQNQGNGTFTDVSREAGIRYEGYGLGIAVADINEDGWPDIYVGNDYVSEDILYVNNRDGTFSNQIHERLKHQSLFSMGTDISDINNDGLADIITLDMLPETNLRRKTVSGGAATYYNYINNREYGYEFQYMRNMLQLNNGDGTFSEIGQMAGIYQTEWSWSSLWADVDNDGNRDLLITNGFPKDVTDRDYVLFKRDVGAFNDAQALLKAIPTLKIPNYVFRNNGDLTFTDMTKEWGFNHPSFSNGAAYADLDNDGDLDYVVNNINDVAFLFENTLYSNDSPGKNPHYLRIKLIGDRARKSTLGSKITIYYDSAKLQYQDHTIYRGYLSTVEDIIHFGLGPSQEVDSIRVRWPDGKQTDLRKIRADQVITISHQQSLPNLSVSNPPARARLLREASSSSRLRFMHKEWDRVDFYRQRTLPHKFSQAGPGIAVGDVNGDGLDDAVIGGPSRYDATIFIQQPDGTFVRSILAKGENSKSEDEGLLLFDADGDSDLDLYVVSGSYEFDPGTPEYQDRLYKNDGRGNFSRDSRALPVLTASGSCVRATDFDSDGDLDLFVGGRVVANRYPLSPLSYLLRNDGGIFEDVTDQWCPELKHVGMVTDALWTDYDDDGKVDLIVVGEFMPITIFRHSGMGLALFSRSGLEGSSGWWNSITGADFDRDGDTDYIIGNLGLNNYYNISRERPLRVYANDFDSNGSIDAILSCYIMSETGDLREYPAHSWDELFAQSPKFRNQFDSYRQYGMTTMAELLQPYDKSGMQVLSANYMLTSMAVNQGDGTFRLIPLPREAQVAPVNGLLATDLDMDGSLDLLITGNDYGNEVFMGRFDACNGLALKGDGHGGFVPLGYSAAGFQVKADARALASVCTPQEHLFLATQNLDSLKVYARNEKASKSRHFHPLPGDQMAQITHEDGHVEKWEFYYGDSYLAQSTRCLEMPAGSTKLVVYDQSGSSRQINLNSQESLAHSNH